MHWLHDVVIDVPFVSSTSGLCMLEIEMCTENCFELFLDITYVYRETN